MISNCLSSGTEAAVWHRDDQTNWNMKNDPRLARKPGADPGGKSILLHQWSFLWSAGVGNDRLISLRVHVCVSHSGFQGTKRSSFAFWQRPPRRRTLSINPPLMKFRRKSVSWRPTLIEVLIESSIWTLSEPDAWKTDCITVWKHHNVETKLQF